MAQTGTRVLLVFTERQHSCAFPTAEHLKLAPFRKGPARGLPVPGAPAASSRERPSPTPPSPPSPQMPRCPPPQQLFQSSPHSPSPAEPTLAWAFVSANFILKSNISGGGCCCLSTEASCWLMSSRFTSCSRKGGGIRCVQRGGPAQGQFQARGGRAYSEAPTKGRRKRWARGREASKARDHTQQREGDLPPAGEGAGPQQWSLCLACRRCQLQFLA